jgi:hypothetical protein
MVHDWLKGKAEQLLWSVFKKKLKSEALGFNLSSAKINKHGTLTWDPSQFWELYFFLLFYFKKHSRFTYKINK